VNVNEPLCHYVYVNNIGNTFDNNVEDVAHKDLTNSRMNNLATRVDKHQSLQIHQTHTIFRFLSLLQISSNIRVRKGNHPYIDYTKYLIMTLAKYISTLKEKGK